MSFVTAGHRAWTVFRYRFVGILGVLLLFAPTSVRAAPPDDNRPVGEARVPSLFGATGLLQAPSAYVQRNAQVSFFLSASNGDGTDRSNASGGAVLGLANRLEIGVRGEKTQGQSGQFLANAKLNLLPEQLLGPALSVGVVDAFSSRDTTETSWYMVASKYLIPYFMEALTGRAFPMKFHVGYGDGVFGRRLFVGAELFPNGRIGGMVEVVHGQANLGVRYYRRGFSATVGLLGGDHIAGNIGFGTTLR